MTTTATAHAGSGLIARQRSPEKMTVLPPAMTQIQRTCNETDQSSGYRVAQQSQSDRLPQVLEQAIQPSLSSPPLVLPLIM